MAYHRFRRCTRHRPQYQAISDTKCKEACEQINLPTALPGVGSPPGKAPAHLPIFLARPRDFDDRVAVVQTDGCVVQPAIYHGLVVERIPGGQVQGMGQG